MYTMYILLNQDVHFDLQVRHAHENVSEHVFMFLYLSMHRLIKRYQQSQHTHTLIYYYTTLRIWNQHKLDWQVDRLKRRREEKEEPEHESVCTNANNKKTIAIAAAERQLTIYFC